MEPSESTAANLDRRSRRRWLQFSLRGFLVVLTAFAVWLGFKVERVRNQREAVKAIEALGQSVRYDWHPPFSQWGSRYPPPTNDHPNGPKWLRALIGDDYFQDVEGVEIEFMMFYRDEVDAAFVPNIIEQLKRLPSLKVLQLDGGQFVPDEVIDQFTAALPHCKIDVPFAAVPPPAK